MGSMWALCGLWQRRIKGGVGGFLIYSILLELWVGMENSLGVKCLL